MGDQKDYWPYGLLNLLWDEYFGFARDVEWLLGLLVGGRWKGIFWISISVLLAVIGAFLALLAPATGEVGVGIAFCGVLVFVTYCSAALLYSRLKYIIAHEADYRRLDV